MATLFVHSSTMVTIAIMAMMLIPMSANCFQPLIKNESICNYNGDVSSDSKCDCRPPWKGDACDILDLVPIKRRDLGYQGLNATTGEEITSWGGSVVLGDDGIYHMYAAEIADSCGMCAWLSNSRVIHATSIDPTKEPFKRQSVVFPVWSHEPIASRAPTGEYVVFFSSVPGFFPPAVKGGNMCTTCKNGTTPAECGNDSNRNASIPLPTFMVYSKNPDGPWSKPVMVPTTAVYADANFAPWINKDGSLVALSRHSVWNAEDWKDMTTYKRVGRWPDGGEDPSLWRDGNGILHAITHDGRPNTKAKIYYSLDDITFVASPSRDATFTSVVHYADGSSHNFGCRERPHLVLNNESQVIALTNGASPVFCDHTGVYDYSYTLLQTTQL